MSDTLPLGKTLCEYCRRIIDDADMYQVNILGPSHGYNGNLTEFDPVEIVHEVCEFCVQEVSDVPEGDWEVTVTRLYPGTKVVSVSKPR